MTKTTANSAMLLAAAIWGFAFVAQKTAMESLGPFSFNALRFLMGAVCLHLVSHFWLSRGKAPLTQQGWAYALLMGLVLFLGANTQQFGLVTTTAGKAAFITGLYIVLVPAILGLLGQTFSLRTWVAVLISLAGLYLLSFTDGITSISLGDLWVLASAFLFAAHILLIGRASKQHDPIQLSIIQFYVCAVLSGIGAWSMESPGLAAISAAKIEILYTGTLSVAVAYTLQVIGQKHVASHIAALILSLEAVFGAIGGYWLLGETMNARLLIGCGLMMFAWVLAQLPDSEKR